MRVSDIQSGRIYTIEIERSDRTAYWAGTHICEKRGSSPKR